MIAQHLLCVLPEELAFWVLCAIYEDVFPGHDVIAHKNIFVDRTQHPTTMPDVVLLLCRMLLHCCCSWLCCKRRDKLGMQDTKLHGKHATKVLLMDHIEQLLPEFFEMLMGYDVSAIDDPEADSWRFNKMA